MNHTLRWSQVLLVLGTLIASILPPEDLHAQTAHPYSVQVSAILTVLSGNYEAGADSEFGDRYVNLGSGRGIEIQLQRRLGVSSLGFGLQFSRHSGRLENEGGETVRDLDGDVSVWGIFLEPRRPILRFATENAAPYVAARVGISSVTLSGEIDDAATGYTLNAGGGVLFRVNRQATVDVGVTFGLRDFGEDLGVFGNALFRVGVFIGIPSGGSGS